MRHRINKALLADMPPGVREIVLTWRDRYGKAHVSVENCPSFYAAEDSRVTMMNLLTGRVQSARTAGEFAGFTKLSPCAAIPVPEGVVAIEEGFFCGHPFLTIYQGVPDRREVAMKLR
jgi:hypothetical protein